MRLPLTTLTLSALLAGAACDSSPRSRDAAAAVRAGEGGAVTLREVNIRFDAPNGSTPAVSVLAYRAAVVGASADELLSAVDPLVGAAPDGQAAPGVTAAPSGCLVRDVAGAARALGAQGGKAELEAFEGLAVDLGAGLAALRLSARVFPDLASVVSGVVTEAAATDLGTAPQQLGVTDGTGARISALVPTLPRLLDSDGAALAANTTFNVGAGAGKDLVLDVSGPASTFVELRPFGATWALACPLAGRGLARGAASEKLIVPASELGRLASLKVPVSFEAVARESHTVVLGGAPARLTLEVRSSSVVELRP